MIEPRVARRGVPNRAPRRRCRASARGRRWRRRGSAASPRPSPSSGGRGSSTATNPPAGTRPPRSDRRTGLWSVRYEPRGRMISSAVIPERSSTLRSTWRSGPASSRVRVAASTACSRSSALRYSSGSSFGQNTRVIAPGEGVQPRRERVDRPHRQPQRQRDESRDRLRGGHGDALGEHLPQQDDARQAAQPEGPGGGPVAAPQQVFRDDHADHEVGEVRQQVPEQHRGEQPVGAVQQPGRGASGRRPAGEVALVLRGEEEQRRLAAGEEPADQREGQHRRGPGQPQRGGGKGVRHGQRACPGRQMGT